jgi:hypothetical protein
MIPTFKIGGVVFSATFTRFAAESMADLSGEFLCIVKLVDQWLKYKLPTQDVPWYVRAEVDKPAMVVAARYSQWISDRLRWRSRIGGAKICRPLRRCRRIGQTKPPGTGCSSRLSKNRPWNSPMSRRFRLRSAKYITYGDWTARGSNAGSPSCAAASRPGWVRHADHRPHADSRSQWSGAVARHGPGTVSDRAGLVVGRPTRRIRPGRRGHCDGWVRRLQDRRRGCGAIRSR